MGKKKQQKKLALGPSIISEATRIRLTKTLDDFSASPDAVFTFEPGLSKIERAAIHMMCKKLGMISKSSGKKSKRQLCVYKKKMNKDPALDNGIVTCLKFSNQTREILHDLFIQYPPEDAELTEQPLQHFDGKSSEVKENRDGSFSRPSISKLEIKKKCEILASKINKDENFKKVAESRAKLPIGSFKDVITSTLDSHQVVLISGETGCGKTTQVPQYILDSAWGKGESCKIICTQPRRVSAISVAERIAYERGEYVGDTVGYKIRLESKGGKNSSILFCTNGILLRVLIGRDADRVKKQATHSSVKDAISEITHVIVDEIHERDRFSDFILAILRDLLASYPHLRLILMSATMDAERFSQYFNGCPVIRVPGFTYPVKSFFLEDVLPILRSTEEVHLELADLRGSKEETQLSKDSKTSLDESIDLALSGNEIDPLMELVVADPTPKTVDYQHSSTGVSPLMVLAGKGKVDEACILLSFGANCALTDHDGYSAIDWAQRENQVEVLEIIKNHMRKDASKTAVEQRLVDRYLACVNSDNVDVDLIKRLLQKICTDSQEGAILVFLPGWDDINQTRERLLESPLFNDSSKFKILCLHSMVPSVEQKNVFKQPPPGVRKIILSTNIAETAVTINDVVYVIDSGRMKERNYDPYCNVSTLYSSWVSKANARQREGRAGRCQPGICYHLYSKAREASLLDHQVPEIKRMPIEELCLQVKLLDSNYKISDFLQKTMDPPVHETIRNAITLLQDIGALTPNEQLTELGKQLGSLPVHPSIGRMIFFAILMNCLDPALTLACAADYRDPFLLPMAPEERKSAAAAKAELASFYGGYSDHLTIIAAYDCWRLAKQQGQENNFCSRYFLSSATMNMLSSMRMQLQKELAKSGFIAKDQSACSLNSQVPGIVRAILLAGTYPMVGRMLPPLKGGKRAVVECPSGAKATLHSHSSNSKLSFTKSVGGLLLTYDEITRGEGKISIKSCSVVSPFSLLFLAIDMVVAPASNAKSDEDDELSSCDEDEMETKATSESQGEEIMSSPENNVSVIVDLWLKFEATALDIAQIYCLRQRLSAAMLFKVKHPKEVLPPTLAASVHAIACIFSYDGMSGISPPLEHVNCLGPQINLSPGRIASGQNSNGFLRSPWMDNSKSIYGAASNVVSAPNSSNFANSRAPYPKTSLHGGGPPASASRNNMIKRRRGSG